MGDAQPNGMGEAAEILVEVKNLNLRAGRRVLLENADGEFPPGSITLIVGPSGVGKTMLLRLLAGILQTHQSEIHASGQLLFGGVPAEITHRGRSNVGVVFQNFALFEELTPRQNVDFALAHRQQSPAQGPAEGDSTVSNQRTSPATTPKASIDHPEHYLQELGIPLEVRTTALSGGQRQRLAVARTLAFRPQVILYDEPTSGLDVATAAHVANLIQQTQRAHRQTSIIVTHDDRSLLPIADRVYVLDPSRRKLVRIEKEKWSELPEIVKALTFPATESPKTKVSTSQSEKSANRSLVQVWLTTQVWLIKALLAVLGSGERVTAFLERGLALFPRMWPNFPSWRWGGRFFLRYFRLVAEPSSCVYIAIAGMIIGFVSTYFTFRFLPYKTYSEPLIIEDLLGALGFALYRVLVPLLSTILIAARCGAAVASDIGGKVFTNQLDAMRTLGARPERYIPTAVLYAFLLGTPLLLGISYEAARFTSMAVFTATHHEFGPFFWESNFYRELNQPGAFWLRGTPWLLAKTLVCAFVIAGVSLYRGSAPKRSNYDVSSGITITILWATLYVLFVHFVFAFFEYEPVR